MDDLKDDNTQPGGPDQPTLAWANDVGYKPDAAVLRQRRRPARRNVFAELGQMQQQGAQPVPVPVVARPSLQIDVTNPQAILIKKAQKGGPDKKTCFVEFGGTTMVLKGGSGDSANHVVHSDFIRNLALPGVRVPASRLLDGTEKQALVAHFQQGDWQSKELATSMTMVNPDGTTAGQLSEQAAGRAPQSTFPTAAEQKDLDELKRRREDLLKRQATQDAAWAETCEAIIKKSFQTGSAAGVKQRATAATAADRAAAIAWMRENCKKDAQLQLVDVLEEIEAGQLAQGLAKLNAEEDARVLGRSELASFAASPAGVKAYAGVAAADLVSGMDDRIMGKFNGGNFLFDAAAGELVCIDNAKNPPQSLGSADNDQWKRFVNGPLGASATLEDAIYQRIYGKGPGSGADAATSAPGNFVNFDDTQAAAAKASIRLTLAQVVTTIEADPNAGQSAKDRAAYLKARMQLEDYFRSMVPLPAPPTPPAKLDATDKIARAGKSFFTSNKKDKRADTQAIKDQLRSGAITAAQARQQLQVLEQAKPSLQNDRRSQKILYLAKVAECAETLQTVATDLNALLQLAPDALNDRTAKPLCASLVASAATWRTRLNDDKKMLALFEAAWKQVPAAIRAP